jgi:Tetratricopeptide repeat
MHLARAALWVSVSCLAISQPARGQQPVSGNRGREGVARADSAFQRGSWQEAAEDYRGVVQADTADGMAWLRLGMSLERLGRSEDATDAYDHAVTLGFQTVRAEWSLARIAVRAGDAQRALEHLRNAAALGIDPAMIDTTKVFLPLHDRPGFADIVKQAEVVRYPCRSEHTFDFWVGTFAATPWSLPDSPPTGQLDNTREYDGCVIVERWVGSASAGMSMSFYDVSRHVWRMVWNDDSNQSNDFEGSYHDGAMRFEGWVLDPEGNRILTRNVLQDVSPDVIRHTYATSPDGGRTWVVQSDGRFTRIRS